MKALVYQGNKTAEVVYDRPKPEPRDDYMLVKTVAVGLNPTDWKHVEVPLAAEGCLIGVDYAGIVEEVGPKVTKNFKKGDRVCGFGHGGNASNKQDGTFAEYISVKGDLQIRIPENMSFEEASTLGCSVGTVGQALYEQGYGLELAPPEAPIETSEPILIYGGSTATGIMAIQFAKLSGYKVLTTCSAKNFELVKKYGADEAFDYKEADCGKKINEYTNNKLKYAFDCVGEESTAKICAEALSTEPGCRYGTIVRADIPRKDVKQTRTLLYDATGESFEKYGQKKEGDPARAAFIQQWFNGAAHYFAEGRVKSAPIRVGSDGLKGILQGFQDMKTGKYSGEKLVYRVAETPEA